MAHVGIAHFKSMVRRKHGVPAGTVLRKVMVTSSKALTGRVVRFTISTDAVDRSGDSVKQNGWELSAFLANPVVLWAHRSDDPPIGKCVDIRVVGGALRADVEYVPADMPVVGDLAEMCLRMNRTGFLNATSVGFIPLDWEVAKDRDTDPDSWFPPIDYTRQDLMEFSLCSVPANPEALIDDDERDQATPLMDLASQGAERAAGRALQCSAKRRLLRSLYG